MTRSILAGVSLFAMAALPVLLAYGLIAAALGGKPGMAAAVESACLYLSGAFAGHLVARVTS